MDLNKIKVSKEIVYGVLVFLLFAFIFSFFRFQIYSFNSWIFALTGEIQQIKFSDEGDPNLPPGSSPQAKDPAKKIQDNNKNRVAAKPAQAAQKSVDSDKPVKSNLPLTPQPRIQVLASVDNIDESKLPALPELRSFNGTEWHAEKTVVKMATDGQSLYASFLCYDSEPKNLVTKYSETEGSASAWKDDSIEFFIMKDRNADHYYQIVSSASGLNHVFYMKTAESGATGFTQDSELPKDFKKPFVRAEKCPEGYKVTMEINLESFGLGRLDNGKEILLQVVRNYRDAVDPKKAELQLFPCFIYADNRTGKQNHDRRAFMPCKAVK
ncbi:MAG TPA: hypothetical protein DET40_16875 [Lentisphaeria bacterium]|nr:MAG: hypothetical protein A2X45_21375 [Lentisphaerae bacterium GWF2_50_93]HCE45215.1 hypothetical protein [Lentisphaeria bacterium]